MTWSSATTLITDPKWPLNQPINPQSKSGACRCDLKTFVVEKSLVVLLPAPICPISLGLLYYFIPHTYSLNRPSELGRSNLIILDVVLLLITHLSSCVYQVLCKEDTDTLLYCRAMCRRGEFPPLTIAFDQFEGY